MRTLSADSDSWTPREQAAIVWNSLHRRRTKLESVFGLQLPDDLRMHNVPHVWIGETTNAADEAFDRLDSELRAILFGRRFSEWLEKQRPVDGRDFLLSVRTALHEADEMIVALRRSGQLQDHADELRRAARLEGWPADRVRMAAKSVLYGSQKSPGCQPRPLWQCEEHARKLASLANSMLDLIAESFVGELEANRQPDVPPTQPVGPAVVAVKMPQKQNGKRMTIDQRMKLVLFEKPESSGWTVSEFQTELNCSRGGIHKTTAWKALEAARKLGKTERRKARRRRTKPGGLQK